MKQKEQNSIAKKFNIRSETLKTYLMNLGNVRNICAHDEKLYDIILTKRIGITEYHRKLKLINDKLKIVYATRDLFSIVIALKLLLEEEQFRAFYTEIIKSINMLEKELKTISIDNVLYKMGFPKNYKKLLKL